MELIRRRKYFVQKATQLRYMGLVAIPLVLLLGGLYYLIYYSVLHEMLIPEAIVVTLLPAMKKVNIVAAIAIPAALFIILRLALIYSNRIVGPFSRLERDMDKIISGDYSVRLKVRAKDEVGHFVDKINSLLDKVQKGR